MAPFLVRNKPELTDMAVIKIAMFTIILELAALIYNTGGLHF